MNRQERFHSTAAAVTMEKARRVRSMIEANPTRRDTPKARAIVSGHVATARKHNQAAIRARREGR